MSGLDRLGLRKEFQGNGDAKLDDRVLDTLEAVAAFDVGDALDAAVRDGELDRARAETAGIEFKRFLALTVLARHEVDGAEVDAMGPSPLVDAVWHECLDDEPAYTALCDGVLGFRLGHGVDPEGPKEPVSSEPMKAMLDVFFSEYDRDAGAGNLASCWPVLR